MQTWTLYIMNKFGYMGIALLILIENLFPPIPSEVILTFGGFMTTYTKLGIVGVIIASTIGSLIGAIILYKIGSLLTHEKLVALLDGNIGKMLRFKKDDVLKTMDNFNQYGTVSVFFGRCIPIIRSLVSLPAGMAKMPMPKFLILTTIGSIIWNTILVGLGAFFGASWEKILSYIDTYGSILFICLGVTILVGYLFSKKKN
jgi:Uncharacterized membrane-associated protein